MDEGFKCDMNCSRPVDFYLWFGDMIGPLWLTGRWVSRVSGRDVLARNAVPPNNAALLQEVAQISQKFQAAFIMKSLEQKK